MGQLWWNVGVKGGESETQQLRMMAHAFEEKAHSNGVSYWLDTDLMRLLGYTDYEAFKSVVMKALSSCAGLEIDPLDDFIRYSHVEPDGTVGLYKFTRMACFLITQYADQNLMQVRLLQYCLAHMADTVMEYADIERLRTRHSISGEEKLLSTTVKQRGVVSYAMFRDKGYRGMYNMSLNELKKRKKFKESDGVLYDRMGSTELAANLFRVTQTTERIKTRALKGQEELEQAAFDVGRSVRKVMKENTGQYPENIPLAESGIKELRRGGKKVIRKIRGMDRKKGK